MKQTPDTVIEQYKKSLNQQLLTKSTLIRSADIRIEALKREQNELKEAQNVINIKLDVLRELSNRLNQSSLPEITDHYTGSVSWSQKPLSPEEAQMLTPVYPDARCFLPSLSTESVKALTSEHLSGMKDHCPPLWPQDFGDPVLHTLSSDLFKSVKKVSPSVPSWISARLNPHES